MVNWRELQIIVLVTALMGGFLISGLMATILLPEKMQLQRRQNEEATNVAGATSFSLSYPVSSISYPAVSIFDPSQ